ncbi:hypothetical protein DFH06DRAFT_534204 [Mycena polygramma]|nr:hypothetical protein DFH06DRAFT_534204 [Mycena polygramma]
MMLVSSLLCLIDAVHGPAIWRNLQGLLCYHFGVKVADTLAIPKALFLDKKSVCMGDKNQPLSGIIQSRGSRPRNSLTCTSHGTMELHFWGFQILPDLASSLAPNARPLDSISVGHEEVQQMMYTLAGVEDSGKIRLAVRV